MNDTESKTFRFLHGGQTLDFLPAVLEMQPSGNVQKVLVLVLTVHCSETC